MSITIALCEKMLTGKSELLSFSHTVPRRYKTYYIKKRNSTEMRLIAHPAKTVKFIQRLAVEELRNYFPIHHCATAYEKGTGIKMNAFQHRRNQYLLKMDFKNFFLSITPELFFRVSEDLGVVFDSEDKALLEGLLFWRLRRNSPLRLSIGAPSSPFVSNLVMYKFDAALCEICESMGVVYTRYADDLTFTTNRKDVLFAIPDIVRQNLKAQCYSKIRINSEKTVFSSKAFNRHITGVTITNEGRLSVGRERKRLVSALIHKFTLGALSDQQIENLKGQLAHVKNIEPDFVVRMKKKYSDEAIAKIFAWKREGFL